MIIDDEKHAIVTLTYLLEQLEGVELVGAVQDSTLAKAQIENLQPDLLLLDIEMPHMHGFEVLNQFDEIPFQVIFTTAYDRYAIRALKINALDYLLKPIDAEELAQAIQKYERKELLATWEQIAQVSQFKNGQIPDTLALSTQKGLHFIKIPDILYFEANGSYTHVMMTSAEKYLVSKNISMFEEILQDNGLFFRAHKSHLVNLTYIKNYIRGEGGDIVMQDGTYITLSRHKKQEFLQLFKKI
ncbi:two component transcriptional regulator, LytTR family [Parapedobacter koreensis]|uniref:Two component transcriptional regulator, LytTR family n=2 Tax=Parapedobacter koreensis TaxID=332977 RepID=A0A1H7EUT6_9SPHI|nr:two component transcriptional regulator, LytTR family [Parapedobacter koreensis]